MVVVNEVDSLTWSKDFSLFNYGLFNTPEWVTSISEAKYPPVYYDFVYDNEVIGKIGGLILNGGAIKGRQLLFYSGPALKVWDSNVFISCLRALWTFARDNRYSRIHIRPFDQHLKELVTVKGYFHTKTSEYIVDYKKLEQLKFSFGFKQNAKKARKAGAIFYKSTSLEVLNRMFELMDSTRDTRKNKYGQDYNPMFMVNLTKESLSRLLDSGIGVLNYAEIDGIIHSVQLNVEKNGQLYGLLMGSDEIAYKNGLPSFIDQNISIQAFETGCQYYNLGLIPPENQGGAGIRKYKEAVGGLEMVSYGYYSYYITYPMKMLNPLLKLSKMIPDNKFWNMIRKVISLG